MKRSKTIFLIFLFCGILSFMPESFATKVAIIQYEVKDPDKIGVDAVLIEKYMREAAMDGAELIVAPETCFYRYEPWEQNGVTMLDLANHYDALKSQFSTLAEELQVSLVIGLREPSGDQEKPVFNTALFIGPDGQVLGKQHKMMPSNSEREWTKAGTSHTVFETPIGRVGMLICKSAKTHWWNTYEKEDNLDLFILIAGDQDATSFDKFSTICNKANCYGVLANQITGPESDGRKGNSAWGYPDGSVNFLGGGGHIFYADLPIPVKNEFKPQPGQIMADPNNPMWMVYNRDNDNDGKPDPYFMCGPGDPESFLYRGKRNKDGTRNGDQLRLIEKLKENGGNCIYLMAVRTHGGDAWKDVESDPETYPDDKHNPWVAQNPALGLNPDILDQWEIWFSEMDKNGITIYLFIYDDAINVGEKLGWPLGASGNLHPGERQFILDLVNKFEHHKNLVWCVMEEGQEIGKNWQQHVSKIAEAIREADDYQHVIASHQLPGGDFYHADDLNIDQFAIQSAYWEAGTTPDSMHTWMVEVWRKTGGKFGLNMSEDRHHFDLSQTGDRETIRKRSWAAAMAGSYVMVFGMDIANTPVEQLQDCKRQQDFFESTDFNSMAPHDDLKYAGTQYVLAAPGESYIAYSSNDVTKLGFQNMAEGKYKLNWFDCVSGETVQENNVAVKKGHQSWEKPAGLGTEVALYITRVDNNHRKASSGNVLNLEKVEKGHAVGSKNTVPNAPDKSVSTGKNTPVDIQLSYRDPDGGPGPYTATVLTQPLHGKLTGVGNDLTYTPSKDFSGTDQFTWKVNDGAGDSQITTVKIIVL
jgi:predicted amidohydrolase